MLAEKFLRAPPGGLARLVAGAGALVAIKAVRCARVEVGFRLRLLLLDRLHHVERNAFVLLAEMHLQRARRLLVGELADLAAVIGDRRRQTGPPTGGEEGGGAAHA